MSAGGKLLGGGSCEFTRTEKTDLPKVYVDRKGRTIVDGKPVFPLGMYVDKPLKGERLPPVVRCDWNGSVSYRFRIARSRYEKRAFCPKSG